MVTPGIVPVAAAHRPASMSVSAPRARGIVSTSLDVGTSRPTAALTAFTVTAVVAIADIVVIKTASQISQALFADLLVGSVSGFGVGLPLSLLAEHTTRHTTNSKRSVGSVSVRQ